MNVCHSSSSFCHGSGSIRQETLFAASLTTRTIGSWLRGVSFLPANLRPANPLATQELHGTVPDMNGLLRSAQVVYIATVLNRNSPARTLHLTSGP